MLVRSCLKSCMLGFSTVWTKNFQMSKLSLERGTGNQNANFSRIIEKAREFQKNIYLCFIDYAKAFVWIITNCGKLLKRWEYQIILPVSWETYMRVKKQQLEPCMEQLQRRQWHPTSTLAWKIPWTEEPGRLQSMGSLRVAHDWATSLSIFTFMHWRRKWQPTPVFLPGGSQEWGSLVGCCLWGRTESDMTEVT